MSRAARAFGRLKAARTALAVAAVLLLIAVIATAWIRRPRAPSAECAKTDATGAEEALQKIEKFRFTSSLQGARTWSIEADRLISAEHGLNRLEGIRSIEIARPGGETLRGRADRGSFAEGREEEREARVVLEGGVVLEGSGGESLSAERVE